MAAKTKLSPEAQKFVDAGRIRGRKRIKDWLPILEELADFDIEHEAKAKRASKIFTILIVAAVVLFFVTTATAESFPFVAILLAVLSALSLIGSLVSLGLSRQWRQGDLEDDARITLLPFFRLIADDISPDAKLDIWLPLVSAVDQKRLERTTKLPASRGKLKKTTFTAATGRVSVPLVDGTTIDLAIDRQYNLFVHSYWTTGRSGKLKHKTKKKWKLLVQLKAAVTPPADRVVWDPEAHPVFQGAGKVKLKEKTKGDRHIRAVVRTWKAKSVGERPAFAVDGEEVLGMVMQLCSTLKAA